jgi:hypothetical protein
VQALQFRQTELVESVAALALGLGYPGHVFVISLL